MISTRSISAMTRGRSPGVRAVDDRLDVDPGHGGVRIHARSDPVHVDPRRDPVRVDPSDRVDVRAPPA
jgi:hypothetical protein